MISFLDILTSVALLGVPISLGVLVVALGLLDDVARTSRGLNVFALYVGFPALILSGLMDGAFTLLSAPGFWLAVPLSQVAMMGWIAILGRLPGQASQRGAIALTALFPNAGYLGLPLSIALFGDAIAGNASLIVAMHVAAGVSLGPWLLVRWSEGHDVTYSVRDVFRQPLVWSPLIGLLGRGLPDAVRVPVLAGIAPLAAAAAPVALFLLGLYIALHWRSVHPREPSLWGHVLTRLFVAPVLATLVVVPLMLWAGLAAQDATLVVLFAATPIAVTTLVLSAHVGVGMASIAGAIVVSTVVALATLPVAIRAALQLSALLGGG